MPFAVLPLLAATLAAAAPPDLAKLDRIDAAVTAAVDRGDCPGAVVVVVHNDAVVYRKAFGSRAKVPAQAPMTVDTVFDLASLTKPVATATVVHQLIDQGKIALADPVAKHWPAFAAKGKGDVTVEQCLLHTTGLTADNAEADYRDGRAKAFERIASLRLEAPPGTRFRYSDVGFLVLGELAERVSGTPLDRLARDGVFAPLKMTDTGYLPAAGMKDRIAPTGKRDGAVIWGEVHDPRAFHLGGVAGHAGLFGTADDLARYCRMLLNGGELDGARVLPKAAVERFTRAAEVPAGPAAKAGDRKLYRSLGWDVDTAFTAQRGEAFARGTGFGHTGFTGTSVWVDPASKTAVVILTNRVHPDDKGSVVELRRQMGTIVGEVITER
jgi:CubicO group peptidase (beta-lactamase class C family)